jgi:deoxyribose-phosphate aldolase
MKINSFIDHTLLKPDTNIAEIKKLVEESKEYGFAAVCIPPYFVRDVKWIVEDSMKIATVVGFPMGFSTIQAKAEEAKKAVEEGADEIDAVINISAIKSGVWSHIKNETDSLVRTCILRGRKLKLIIETGLLTRDEILKTLEISAEMGVHYIKTSTGFNGEGATVDIVKFIRENLDPKIKIKASGGIKTYEQAMKMIEAGADRIGSSSSIFIANSQFNKTKV